MIEGEIGEIKMILGIVVDIVTTISTYAPALVDGVGKKVNVSAVLSCCLGKSNESV